MSKYLHVFQTIKFFNGIKQGLLVDPLSQSYCVVPNSMIKFINEFNFKSKNEIYEVFKDEINALEEYLNFFLRNDYAEWIDYDSIQNFKIDFKDYEYSQYPPDIMNIILDLDSDSIIKKDEITLKKINASFLQVRVFSELSFENYCKILELVSIGQFLNVEIFFFNYKVNVDILKLFVESSYVSSVFLSFESEIYSSKITVISNSISCKGCGIVSLKQFNTSIYFINESQQFNTCLNRKLSIDSKGNIKNCPSMSKSYGNINDENLDIESIVKSEDFQKVWHINKEKINICKVCEFRHICTDCRAYLEDPEDIYSKPLKCGYNPFTCEWEEWSTHPMKQKAIDFYEMRELIK